MLDERIHELINAGLDGELSAAQLRDLDEALAQSSEARMVSDELRKLSGMLGEISELDPPPGLSGRILDRVELPPRKTFLSWFGLSPQSSPAAYGLAFAAGLLMAVGFYELAPAPPAGGDMSGMVGTLTGGKKSAGARRLQQFTVESGVIEGMVSLNAEPDMLLLEFNLDSTAAVGIDVNLEGTGLSFGGFAQNESGIEALEISESGLKFVNQGAHQFAVILREEAEVPVARNDIEVDFKYDGNQVFGGGLPLQ